MSAAQFLCTKCRPDSIEKSPSRGGIASIRVGRVGTFAFSSRRVSLTRRKGALTITARLLRSPAPQERDGERSDCQQDDADAVKVCGARQTNDGCKEACRKRGKAEGKIAHNEIGGQQASAFAWLRIRQHAAKRSGKDRAEAGASRPRMPAI